jgi:hypothetical protein
LEVQAHLQIKICISGDVGISVSTSSVNSWINTLGNSIYFNNTNQKKNLNLSNQCHFEGGALMILVFFFLALYCPSFYQIWYCSFIRTFVALFLATIVFVLWIFFAG